jgi:hypothetical protein
LLAKSAESYDDIGRINTLVYLPAGENPVARPVEMSFGAKFRQSWKLFLKLWFAPLSARRADFHNLNFNVGAAKRFSFALLTALITPIFLPVGTIFVLLHALRSPGAFQHARHCPGHKADGSCCRGH